MAAPVILDESSLAQTLWNLEEARLAGTKAGEPQAAFALGWVASRHGKPGSYRHLFALTETDLAARRAMPTGKSRTLGRAGAMHILGEEAARALALWGHEKGWQREAAWNAIRGFGAEDPCACFCCSCCSVARWRALSAGQPEGWEDMLCRALGGLREKVASNGRWDRFPFYYTLLALSEMPMTEADTERRRVRPAAERALKRLTGDDQVTRFRRRALEWAAA